MGEDSADITDVVYRPPKRPLRRPIWRERIPTRFGMPVLGVVLAIIAGWLITHL
jgi:hypothetical protein